MAIILLLAGSACAQEQLKGVEIEQKLGSYLPLSITVQNDAGVTLPLDHYFHRRPVLLSLVYYRCPGLCSYTLNQLTRSLNILSESAGKEFDILTVSFDPNETAQLAAEKKEGYLRAYRRASAEEGWRFCVASADQIKKLTEAVGFKYRWDAENKVYSHASVVVVLTPEGKISKYFLGVEFAPNDIRAAIRGARDEKVEPPAEQVFLYCFHYSPKTGKYGLIIDRATKVFGGMTVFAIIGMIGGLSARNARKNKSGTDDKLGQARKREPGETGDGEKSGEVTS